MTAQTKVDVIIATPGRSMDAPYVRSLVKTLTFLNGSGISYYYANQYSPRVDAAREATAMDSLFLDITQNSPLSGKIQYKKIIWIDSDMEWEPLDFMALYDSKNDIVSGFYLSNHGVPMFQYAPDLTDDKQTLTHEEIDIQLRRKISAGEPFEIDAAGFGFIGMKAGIFESMSRPWFQTSFARHVDEATQRESAIPIGEDFSWCFRAKEAGHAIYLDPKIRLIHHKSVPIAIRGEDF